MRGSLHSPALPFSALGLLPPLICAKPWKNSCRGLVGPERCRGEGSSPLASSLAPTLLLSSCWPPRLSCSQSQALGSIGALLQPKATGSGRGEGRKTREEASALVATEEQPKHPPPQGWHTPHSAMVLIVFFFYWYKSPLWTKPPSQH